MNVQETYWPVYTSNHLEAGFPLYELFSKLLPKFRRECMDLFEFEGAQAVGEMGPNGEPYYGHYATHIWPGNGAWLSHHFWLHWLYSRDESFLRKKALPIMRAFMQTYLNLVEKDEEGTYHLPFSHSPEFKGTMVEGWGRDTSCDLFLMRWLARALLDAARILGITDPDIARWKDLIENLAEAPQGEDGLHLFEGQPLQESHRHHSHLMGIHPLGVLTIEGTDEEKELIERSMTNLRWKGTGAWSGCSFLWASLIASRAGHKQMAWKMLRDYFCFIRPSSLHVNRDPRKFGVKAGTAPMTIEAGFCFAAAVMEMLLQSCGGLIRVFPAVPEFWHDGYFHSLRAEGAFLVTARMREGRVVFVEVTSEAGGVCRVKNPFAEDVRVVTLDSEESSVLSGEILTFETNAGNNYRLNPADAELGENDLVPLVPVRKGNEAHWFGLKRLPRF